MKQRQELGWLIVLFSMISTACFAQYDFEHIPNTKPVNFGIHEIIFDDEGGIWMGTMSEGIMYYNGQSVINYNIMNSELAGNYVSAMLVSETGQIWIGTENGLSIFDGESWTSFTSENSSLPDDFIASMEMDQIGRKWIGTSDGLIDGLFGHYFHSGNSGLPGNEIREIVITSDTAVCFGTDGGLGFVKNGLWETFPTGINGLPDAAIVALEEDTTGCFWVSFGLGVNGLLYRFCDGDWEQQIPFDVEYEGARVTAIASKDNGEIWMGTHHEGLLLYKDSSWQQFTYENSNLPINQIISLAIDTAGTVWLGSRAGLTKIITVASSAEETEDVNKSITVFPNPARDQLNLLIDNDKAEIYDFDIYDLNGKLRLSERNLYGNELRVTGIDLPGGMYYFTLRSSYTVYSGRLVFY